MEKKFPNLTGKFEQSRTLIPLFSDWLMPLLVAEGFSQADAKKYQKLFDQQQLTRDLVADISRQDLKDMGIIQGHIIRIEKALKKLKLQESQDE